MLCYRVNPAGEDPGSMLRAEGQWTEPWGGSEHGARCEKCRQSGRTDYACWSCLLTQPTADCPACRGRVRFVDVCPVCRGNGTVDGAPRHGVSTYPRLEGLYHYMLVNDADLDDCLIVALEADHADELDFDADQGALLVIPTEIHDCLPVDRSLLNRVRERGLRMGSG